MGRSYSAKRLHSRGHNSMNLPLNRTFLCFFYIFTEIRNIMIDNNYSLLRSYETTTSVIYVIYEYYLATDA